MGLMVYIMVEESVGESGDIVSTIRGVFADLEIGLQILGRSFKQYQPDTVDVFRLFEWDVEANSLGRTFAVSPGHDNPILIP